MSSLNLTNTVKDTSVSLHFLCNIVLRCHHSASRTCSQPHSEYTMNNISSRAGGCPYHELITFGIMIMKDDVGDVHKPFPLSLDQRLVSHCRTHLVVHFSRLKTAL